MLIDTNIPVLQPWASTDLTTTSYSNPVAVTDEPMASSTRAIIELGQQATTNNILRCLPVGLGADDSSITGFRVWGWSFLPNGALGTTKGQWEPHLLFELAGTLCTATGPTGGRFAATYRRLDAITMVIPASITDAPWLNILSPGSNIGGWFRFDAQGFKKLELTVDLGTATAFNCFVGGY